MSKLTKHFSLTEVATAKENCLTRKPLTASGLEVELERPAQQWSMLALPGQDIRMLMAGVHDGGNLPSLLTVACLQGLCSA